MARINGMGEYFTEPLSGAYQDGVLGNHEQVFRDGSLGHNHEQVYTDGVLGGDPSGIGSVYRDGSLGHAYRDGSLGATIRSGAAPAPTMRRGNLARSAMLGLGGEDISQTEMTGVIVLGLVVRGIAGYFAGCAMGDKYKWWGAGSAAVGGALGVGILGFIAYQKKH